MKVLKRFAVESGKSAVYLEHYRRYLPVTVLNSQKEIVGRASLGKLISLVRQRRCAIGCVET